MQNRVSILLGVVSKAEGNLLLVIENGDEADEITRGKEQSRFSKYDI